MLKMRNAHVKLVSLDIESQLNDIARKLSPTVTGERVYQVDRRPMGPICYIFLYQERSWFFGHKISVTIMINGPANYIKISIRNGEHSSFFKNNLVEALKHLNGAWEIKF